MFMPPDSTGDQMGLWLEFLFRKLLAGHLNSGGVWVRTSIRHKKEDIQCSDTKFAFLCVYRNLCMLQRNKKAQVSDFGPTA
jgi:hypothetical protein